MKPAIFVRIAIVICPAEGNKYLLDDVTYHPATSLNNSLNAKQRSQFRPSSSDQKVYRFKDLPFQRFTVSKIYRFKDLRLCKAKRLPHSIQTQVKFKSKRVFRCRPNPKELPVSEISPKRTGERSHLCQPKRVSLPLNVLSR
jgi:hypothetical protein